jgi:alpha-1,6-mannosyltransferase
MLALTLWLGYGLERADFPALAAAYALLSALYAAVIRWGGNSPAGIRWFVGTGLVLRAALLFALPNLSDDFYRFLWDGRLVVEGWHPFAHTPAWFMEKGLLPSGLTPEWYARLNSPHYHTVYPPVCQAVFALAARISPQGWWGGVVVMKLFLLACECGTLALLCRPWPAAQPFPAHRAVLYALNPLVILEISGNAHFEGAMIFFLLLGLRRLAVPGGRAFHRYGSAAAWALATASKLLPPLFVPLVWRRLGFRAGGRWVLVFLTITLLVFLPLLDPEVLANLGSSLGLYFQKFAFNASLYYLLREAAVWMDAYHLAEWMGRLLGLGALGGVLWITWRVLRPQAAFAGLVAAMLGASCLYLFTSSTVHPWYVTVPFALSLFTTWRFPLVWTAVVFLSYSHYENEKYAEQIGWIALEYAVVLFVAIREWRREAE